MPSRHNSTIKPVKDYFLNGPIPPEDLAFLDFVESYFEKGIIDTVLDVHFMLETIILNGAPKWWPGSAAEFEEEFNSQYQERIRDLDTNSDLIQEAAQAEVKAQRLSPLPENPTKGQLENFLAQGRKRLEQSFAVELLLDMWINAIEKKEE